MSKKLGNNPINTPSEELTKKSEPVFKNVTLIIYLVVLVIARSVDYVLYVRLSNDMMNYAWYLGSIILTVAFCIISWPIVWYKMIFTNHITPEMRATPIYIYIFLGAFDAIGNILATIPAPKVPGPLQVIMSQLLVPANMLLSFIFLKSRYHILHGIGVLLVIVGVFVALIPEFGNFQNFDVLTILYLLILALAVLPQAGSNVYKEHALKKTDLDVWYFNAWVATFQLIIGAVTIPMVFNNVLAGGNSIDPNDLPGYIESATRCFLGYNSQPTDVCDETLLVFVFYIIFNMTFNIALLVVFKEGSATLAVVAGALRVALSAFGFQIPFIAGPAWRSLNPFDYAAVAILIIALIVYKIREEKKETTEVLLDKNSKKRN